MIGVVQFYNFSDFDYFFYNYKYVVNQVFTRTFRKRFHFFLLMVWWFRIKVAILHSQTAKAGLGIQKTEY